MAYTNSDGHILQLRSRIESLTAQLAERDTEIAEIKARLARYERVYLTTIPQVRSGREIDAITEHFDPDNQTLLARAVNRTGRAKLEAIRTNNYDKGWIEAIATIYPAEGEGIVVNAMFVPLACLREVGDVLLKYIDDIDSLTERFRQE